MCIKSIVIAATILVISNSANAALIAAGQVYDYTFTSLAFIELFTVQNQGGAGIFLSDDLLDPGDIVRLELFENSVSDTAFFTNDFTDPTYNFGVGVFNPVPWQDLQGSLRLSVLSGSINLNSIFIQVFNDGSKYSETTYISSVPIPSATWLFGSGLIGLIGVARRKA